MSEWYLFIYSQSINTFYLFVNFPYWNHAFRFLAYLVFLCNDAKYRKCTKKLVDYWLTWIIWIILITIHHELCLLFILLADSNCELKHVEALLDLTVLFCFPAVWNNFYVKKSLTVSYFYIKFPSRFSVFVFYHNLF